MNYSLPILGLINSGKEPNMKHKIGIVWGTSWYSGFDLYQYSFNTQAELDAFIYGMNEMNGWHGCHVIGKNGDFATVADLKKEFE